MGRAPTGSIRKLPSGRWQVRYIDPDGVRRSAPRTFIAKRDAATYLAQVVADISRGTYTEARASMGVRFDQYAQRWLDTRLVHGRPLADRTQGNYRALLRDHLVPYLGTMQLHQIGRDDVDRWFERVAPGHPTTRARAYSLLRTVMNSAVDADLIDRSPCRIRGGSTAPARRRTRAATPEEIARLVAATPERYRMMILFAAYTGVRVGELTELRRGDVDIANGVVHVRRAVVLVDGAFVVKEPKSAAGSRTIALPPQLVPLLAQHLLSAAAPGADGLLFPSVTDHRRQMLQSAIFRWFTKARTAAGLPTLRWHDLRHASATWSAQSGATTAEIMARHGWSSVAVMARYQHASAERDQQLAARLPVLPVIDVG